MYMYGVKCMSDFLIFVINILDEEMNNDDDGQESLNIGKIGTKKLKKMQAKAEKKALREVL